jgi:hypothetical protein
MELGHGPSGRAGPQDAPGSALRGLFCCRLVENIARIEGKTVNHINNFLKISPSRNKKHDRYILSLFVL